MEVGPVLDARLPEDGAQEAEIMPEPVLEAEKEVELVEEKAAKTDSKSTTKKTASGEETTD